MPLIRHSIIQRENPMLSNLYQQKVYLIIHLYPHCLKAMRLWTNAVDRGLVQRTPNYIRCKLVMAMTDPRQVCIQNVDSFEADLEYVMESAIETVGQFFEI